MENHKSYAQLVMVKAESVKVELGPIEYKDAVRVTIGPPPQSGMNIPYKIRTIGESSFHIR